MSGQLVLVSGFPRTGKTTLSTFLQKELGFTFVSLDVMSERLHGWTDLEQKEGDPQRKEKKLEVLNAVREEIWRALRAGENVVVDAAASYERKRSWYLQLPPELPKIERTVIVVRSSEEKMRQRAKEAGRENDAVNLWNQLWEEPTGAGYRILTVENNNPGDLEKAKQTCREYFGGGRRHPEKG